MAEYGDYKKEIKTLGDLRTFVNETLKGIEDDYTFDIDDDFMGIDIVLTANCDVSYSSKSFYWTANVNFVKNVVKVVDDRIKAKHKIKALEIIKEYQVDVWLLKQCDYENYIRIRKEAMVSVGQIVNENGIILEDEITKEYFDLVKRWVE